MSKENKVEESAEETTVHSAASVKTEELKTKKKNKPAGVGFLYFLILIIISAMIAASYYFFEEQKNQNTLLKQQANKILMLDNKMSSNNTQSNKRDEVISQINQQLQIVIANADEAKNISQQAANLANRSQRGWALAEVDYLLRMAHRRLEVAKDIAGAVAALQGADSRLEELSDLKLFKIRKQLAKDIASLGAIKQADISGISLAVDQTIAHVSELPFKSVQSKVKAQLESSTSNEVSNKKVELEKTFVDSVIETVKQIGDIRIHQQSLEVVSSGIQQKQIEQLLYSHLIALKLAALNYHQDNFEYEVQQMIELLNAYYDTSNNRIKQLKAKMDEYSKVQLSPVLPELTKAWEMLQEEISRPVYKNQQEPEK